VKPPARDSDRTSDAFIRHVGHDLRASLNVVVSWAELVKSGQLPPDDVSRAGDTIVRHARHLSERLGVALDLWRLDRGLLTPSLRVASVGAMVRAAVDDARRNFDSRRVNCRLDVRGDGSASVDAPRLVQALVVLLGDAAVNTPADQSVEVAVDADGGDHLVISIVGGGLMPGEKAFSRNVADTSASGSRRPFDFGLALAKELIELNGGALAVEPADGDRVAAVVRLPVTHPQNSTRADP
jgi:K+-sensing histidine kinase KdpD